MSLALQNNTQKPARSTGHKITEPVSLQRDVSHEAELKKELWQAQKMEAIGQLAGGVAHDFNNLLVVMMGYTDLALDGLSPDEKRYRDMKKVLQAAEKAARLTRQLLAFGRRQTLEMKDTDLNELTDGILKMIRRVIGEDIKVGVVVDNELATVSVDPGQIEQVIMNLCVNARDAMPDGGTLSIETKNVWLEENWCETHPWARPGHYALIGVKDTGCGMNTEISQNVFEPFFTTKEEGKGTGLGLSTVYGIVKQHEGLINVRSEVNEGTIFDIYLPVVERSTKATEETVKDEPPGGTETILLAEDDETVRDIGVRVLEEAGYTVHVASNGSEAVEVFKEHNGSISLALLDVVMPELKGREVYDRISKIDPTACFLFSSGYSPEGIHTHFVLDEGMHSIQKPYDPNSLLCKVREVLDEAA